MILPQSNIHRVDCEVHKFQDISLIITDGLFFNFFRRRPDNYGKVNCSFYTIHRYPHGHQPFRPRPWYTY